MDLGIQGKKALVLASSEGLGKGIAQELIAEGVETAICSRNLRKLEKTAEEIGASAFFEVDLTSADSVKSLIAQANDHFGNIDILITNAGGPPAGTFADISSEQWQVAYQSLFMSIVETIHGVLPGMTQQGWGRIVMVTSVAGKEPIKNLTVSSALRAGVHGLMNTISKEVGPSGEYNPKGEKLSFYQSGSITCMVKKVKVVGKMQN